MLQSEINQQYPHRVIKHISPNDRDVIIQWIIQNIPDHDWMYQFYYLGLDVEAIEVNFNDRALATLFSLKF